MLWQWKRELEYESKKHCWDSVNNSYIWIALIYVYIIEFGSFSSVALVVQWLEHQTSMGHSNSAGSSLSSAFFSHTFFFYNFGLSFTLTMLSRLVNDGSVELLFTLICCWIRFFNCIGIEFSSGQAAAKIIPEFLIFVNIVTYFEEKESTRI